MNGVTRRDLLAAAGAGVGLSTAGCLGSGDGGDGSDDPDDQPDEAATNGTDTNATAGDDSDAGDANPDDDGATASAELPSLQYVRVENDHDQPHTAHVLVENGGEIVHWSSHEVTATDAVTLDRNWTAERGEFVVSIRIDDQSEWSQIDLTKERPNCYGVIPRITADGSITRLWERNPAGCGESTDEEETN